MNHGMCSIPIKGCLIAMFNLFIELNRIGLSIMIQWWIHNKIVTNFGNNTGAEIFFFIFAKFQLGNWHKIHHICEVPIEKPKLNLLNNYTYQYCNLMYKNNLYENTLHVVIIFIYILKYVHDFIWIYHSKHDSKFWYLSFNSQFSIDYQNESICNYRTNI